MSMLPKPFDLPLAEGDEIAYYKGSPIPGSETRGVVFAVGWKKFYYRKENGKLQQLSISRISKVWRDGVLVAEAS
jgi:hypothetical protein